MEFCPTCANLLQYDNRIPARFFCRTCPYVCPIRPKAKITRSVQLPKKGVTSVVVGGKSVKPTTDVPCPKCHHGKAEYEQRQIRSADEPMTIIYKCLNESCGHGWREE